MVLRTSPVRLARLHDASAPAPKPTSAGRPFWPIITSDCPDQDPSLLTFPRYHWPAGLPTLSCRISNPLCLESGIAQSWSDAYEGHALINASHVCAMPEEGVARRSPMLSTSAAASGFSTTLTFSDEYHPTGEKVLGIYADTVVAQVTFTGTVDWFRLYPDGHQDFILTFDASGVCPGSGATATAVGIYNDVGVHLPPLPCIQGASDRGPTLSRYRRR